MVALLAATAACRISFDLIGETEDAAVFGPGDAPRERPDATSDTVPTCNADGIFVTGSLGSVVLASETFDTDVDSRCSPDRVDACLVAGDQVTVEDGANVIVGGSRPLIVFACTTLHVGGHLDASSTSTGRLGAAANDESCVIARGEDDTSAGGGGAGGSFASQGGQGGVGDTQGLGEDGFASGGLPAPAAADLTTPRGGCPGGRGGNVIGQGLPPPVRSTGGAGGAGGGALWLIGGQSITITTTGIVSANGAGGLGGSSGPGAAGGGGGGSGGWIRIAAPTITIDGIVTANGGGGGGGAGFTELGMQG